MKIILVSDVNSENKSTIPYGLKLAAALKAEVTVVHMIDTRSQHGTASSYADSHTVSPGGKLSFEEVTKRNKSQAKKNLDNVLSSETSRLNYPLKVNTIIEEDSVVDILERLTSEANVSLVVYPSKPDHHTFAYEKEIVQTCKEVGTLSLLVPPGFEFKSLENNVLLTDFSEEDNEQYKDISAVMSAFHPRITGLAVVKNEDERNTMNGNGHAWKEKANTLFQDAAVESDTTEGKDDYDAIAGYIQHDGFSSMILCHRKKSAIKRLFSSDDLHKLFEKVNIPVLFHAAG